jgi:hypothetical protein
MLFHSFADRTSFKPLKSFAPNYGTLGNAMDPTSLWPASMDQPDTVNQQKLTQAPVQPCDKLQLHRNSLSSSPLTIAQRRNIAIRPRSSITPTSTPTSTPASTISHGRPLFAQIRTPASLKSDSAVSASPGESEKTRRAHYAANKRHSKAQKARKGSQQNDSTSETDTRVTEQKQRHREKNKVAAAKCRLRQRKQVQRIQENGSRLGEKNAELKTTLQELHGELYELRSMALDHQRCNCSIARYNHKQATRVVAEYSSSCLRQGSGGFGHLPEKQGFKMQ